MKAETIKVPDEAPKPQHDEAGRFVPGQSGNPAGRPKGARSKLTEQFLKAMLEDFEAHGIAAIAKVREDKPDQYLKVVAAIIPKEITGEDGGPIPFVQSIQLIGVHPEPREG